MFFYKHLNFVSNIRSFMDYIAMDFMGKSLLSLIFRLLRYLLQILRNIAKYIELFGGRRSPLSRTQGKGNCESVNWDSRG